MSFDPQPFRQQYRAAIRPGYNPWLHAGFVLAYGGAWIVFFLSRLEQPSLLEWLTVPAALVFFNWGEYRIHKSLGHHKHPLGRMFYKRHTGDHHSFFVAGQMRYEQARDWRVILFPAWLVVVFSLGALLAWSLLGLLNDNLAALFAATLLLGYLSYEIFHACEHLPPEHPLSRLPDPPHAPPARTASPSRADADAQLQPGLPVDGLVLRHPPLGSGTRRGARHDPHAAPNRDRPRARGDPRLRRQPGTLAGMASSSLRVDGASGRCRPARASRRTSTPAAAPGTCPGRWSSTSRAASGAPTPVATTACTCA